MIIGAASTCTTSGVKGAERCELYCLDQRQVGLTQEDAHSVLYYALCVFVINKFIYVVLATLQTSL